MPFGCREKNVELPISATTRYVINAPPALHHHRLSRRLWIPSLHRAAMGETRRRCQMGVSRWNLMSGFRWRCNCLPPKMRFGGDLP
ncbi:hypothetical protein E2C01_018937 [Portunus trituberculatus]|uniref:Uncharacterized protein n=1 Tax=Portunus trituberculatus TaxID=210409 RepID=A0A5B7DYF9_PORTR|nr:hypothetical protein [Portunus trituberculatus]